MTLRYSEEERARIWSKLVSSIDEYFRDVDSLRVIPEMDPMPVREAVGAIDLEHGQEVESLIDTVVQDLRRFQLHEAHPLYFGLFNPSPSTMGVVGDALAAAFNPQLAAWSHSPWAIEVERRLVDELARIFGFPEGRRDGTFASGGAEANHTALLCALTNRFDSFGDRGARAMGAFPTVYVSEAAHHSTFKAARISGIGGEAVRTIPTSARDRLDLDGLRDAIAADRGDGRTPFMVVATAGTTGAGTIEPVAALGDLARDERLWFHVDAAWGGAAMLVDEMRDHFRGIETADSITFDAHKWLSVPMGAGLFLTRHPGILERTFGTSTGYMPREADGLDVVNPYLSSIQWSRRFIGLKIFLSIAATGWEGYREVIRHQIRMGGDLRELLTARGWKIVNDTPLPVVCFREAGETGADRTERIVSRVVGSGRAWVSTTTVAGGPAIRACITNFATTREHLEQFVEILEEARLEE